MATLVTGFTPKSTTIKNSEPDCQNEHKNTDVVKAQCLWDVAMKMNVKCRWHKFGTKRPKQLSMAASNQAH